MSFPSSLCAHASWARSLVSELWSRRLTEPPRPANVEERKFFYRQYRTNELVRRRMNFSSDAMADFEGLLEVNRKICKQQMAEKASPTLPTNCAVLPISSTIRCRGWSPSFCGRRQRVAAESPQLCGALHWQVAAALSAAVTTTKQQETTLQLAAAYCMEEKTTRTAATLRERGSGGEALLLEKRPLPQNLSRLPLYIFLALLGWGGYNWGMLRISRK